jgi:translation initiation factor IF-1
MAKEEVVEFRGKVIDILPNNMFKVELPNGHVVIAYSSGKIKQNKIRILLDDEVTVAVSPYDLNRGRVTYRH